MLRQAGWQNPEEERKCHQREHGILKNKTHPLKSKFFYSQKNPLFSPLFSSFMISHIELPLQYFYNYYYYHFIVIFILLYFLLQDGYNFNSFGQ